MPFVGEGSFGLQTLPGGGQPSEALGKLLNGELFQQYMVPFRLWFPAAQQSFSNVRACPWGQDIDQHSTRLGHGRNGRAFAPHTRCGEALLQRYQATKLRSGLVSCGFSFGGAGKPSAGCAA